MTELYKDTILTEKETIKIVNLIRSKESLTLIWLPGSGRTHLGHMFQNEEFFNKIMTTEELEKIIVVYVDQDINIKYLETHILGNLSQYGSYHIVNEALFNLINKGHHIIFVIDNFHLDKEFFDYMNALRSVSVDNISFIFLILQGEYDNLVDNYPNADSLIYHNIIKIAYFTDPQALEWTRRTAKELHVNLKEADIEMIVSFSGGIPLIIKNYIRLTRKYPKHETLIKSQEMRILLLKLLGMFTKPARRVLESLYTGSNLDSPETRYILSYFVELGLIDKNYKIRGEWLNELFLQKEKSALVIENGRVYVQDIDHTHNFTSKEFNFLQKILTLSMITRDDLSAILFDKSEEYSDWAIDQFVSRTRKKLKSLGLNRGMIKTVRGKGYKLGR